jgi:hypothetical protein
MPTQTYTPIARQVLASSAATVTISDIPSTYTDLVFVFEGTATGSFADIGLRVNGDTSSNYSDTILYGNGSNAGSARHSNLTFTRGWYIPPSSTRGITKIDFLNYSNTTTYKTFIGRSDIATTELEASVGLWRSTAAITSISITPQGTSVAAGSTVTLYGIKAGS